MFRAHKCPSSRAQMKNVCAYCRFTKGETARPSFVDFTLEKNLD